MSEDAPQPGWESPEVRGELPGLQLLQIEQALGRPASPARDSPPDVLERLREHSSRLRGPRAIALRREPITSAYRVFYRQVGLDPDVQRTPLEEAVLERVMKGGFPTGGLLADILALALLDTGVPVWALDAGTLRGPLGIRASVPGERLGPDLELSAGRLVVADSQSPVATLFGEPAADRLPSSRSERLRLFAVRVPGVPELFAEEALWSVRNALGDRW